MIAITTKSRYAVSALVELARRGSTGPVPINEIARRRDIPVQFLEGLFGALRRAGILQSQRGAKGGYTFARPPEEVSVLEVVEVLDGELGAGASVTGGLWQEAAGALRGVLGGITIAEAAEREARTRAPMYHI